MNSLAPAIARVLFCISLAGITSTLLYLYLRKDEEEIEETNEGIRTSRPVTIEVKIPIESVGVVIGRGGVNIKEIQEKSDTKINFKDDHASESFRMCVIRGTTESAQLAESLIHEFISNQPLIETSDMLVPQRACGRIIGRNGENIRSIARASSAKITVETSTNKDPCSERRVIIKGTAEQIELAKSLIKEKVDEDDDLRKKLEENLSSRSPRKKDRQNFLTAGDDAQTSAPERQSSERLSASGSDGLIEVYVSAVHNPDKFWLQVIGPRAVELDRLVEHMTDYYNKDENKELHAIKELRLGHVVAAPFSFDGKWYRAEVTDITEDEYDPQESLVSLYYVDYGDSGDLKKKDVCELRTDFLRLRFQAVECCLAKVLPKGGKWSDEAIDLFEELTHNAQWVIIMARIDSYKERERGHGKREGSPVPCIELFDTTDSKDICIAEELVKQGFAEWEKCENKNLANGESSSAPKSSRAVADDKQARPVEEDKKKPGRLTETGAGDAGQEITASSSTREQSVMYGPDESDEGSSDEMEMG